MEVKDALVQRVYNNLTEVTRARAHTHAHIAARVEFLYLTYVCLRIFYGKKLIHTFTHRRGGARGFSPSPSQMSLCIHIHTYMHAYIGIP